MQTILNILGFKSVRGQVMELIQTKLKKAFSAFFVGQKAIAEQLWNDIESAKDVAVQNEKFLLQTLVSEVIADITVK